MEKREPTALHRWWEYKLVQSLWRMVGRFLIKLKMELPCNNNPTPGLVLFSPTLEKILIWNDTHTLMFIAALFTIAKIWEQPHVHWLMTNEWTKEVWYIHTMEWKWKCYSLNRVFAIPWTVACQAPLPMEFSRHEYWSGLPFPTLGDLPDSGIELGSPTLWAVSLTSELAGKPIWWNTTQIFF